MYDNWDQVDPSGAHMLALTTNLHSIKGNRVLLTNMVANNNNNTSNNKGRGGPGGSRMYGPGDWKYVKECDTKEVRGKTR